jgi:hypothetical protein
MQSKLCLLLQFFIIKRIQSSFKRDRLNKTLKVKAFYIISLISLCALGTLIGFGINPALHEGSNNFFKLGFIVKSINWICC